MWGFFIAIISGALMSVQGVFNTGVSKEAGNWLTNSFVQLTAFLVCICIWLFTERKSGNIGALFSIDHKYMLLGGVIGAFITFTVMLSMKNLGPGSAALIIVSSQIIVAYLIEVFGLFSVEKTEFHPIKLAGIILVLAGISIFQLK